jgi:pimeloyl-ACP methyl ester carboxylesterase
MGCISQEGISDLPLAETVNPRTGSPGVHLTYQADDGQVLLEEDRGSDLTPTPPPQATLKASWEVGRLFLGGPELSLFDLPNLARGLRFSLNAMLTETSNVNLIKLVPALQMPVFFFLGRHDGWVPPETSVTYLNMLAAPSKTLIWFDESGHEPFVDEADKFNTLMAELVRPVAG